MTLQSRKASGASKTRVQNTTNETTVKSSAGVLHRIVLSNANGAAQTLTVTDGSTVQIVLNIAATSSNTFQFDATFTTSIKVTPSNTGVDALVVYS